MAKAPTSVTPGQEMARKLSVATLGWKKGEILKLVIADQENMHHLARFVGIASALKPYRNKQEGDRQGEIMYGMVGQFEGTSSTGEVQNAPVLFLPGFMNEMVAAILTTGEVAEVRIACDVYAKFDEASATSYTFSVFDLINKGAESVAEVKAEIAALPMPSRVAALPAPDTE